MKRIFIIVSLLLSSLAFGAESIGTVLGVVGSVTVSRDNKTIVAERKTSLYENDTIISGDNARAQLRFADGTLTTIGANTAMKINMFSFQKKTNLTMRSLN